MKKEELIYWLESAIKQTQSDRDARILAKVKEFVEADIKGCEKRYQEEVDPIKREHWRYAQDTNRMILAEIEQLEKEEPK